jgi:hypothetical protein
LRTLASLAATLLLGTLAPPAQAGYVAGLGEGQLSGAFNLTDPNPMTTIVLSPRMGETNAWPFPSNNVTWVYSGQVYDADGVFSFGENISESVWVRVDGMVRMNNTAAGTPSTTGIINAGPGPYGDGWHDLEIRIGAGDGAQGAVEGSGWTASKGFGFNAAGTTSTDGGDYVVPTDPGSMLLLRVSTVPEPSTATLALAALGALTLRFSRRK